MTPAELRARTAKLRALAQAATLGPWVTRDPIRAAQQGLAVRHPAAGAPDHEVEP